MSGATAEDPEMMFLDGKLTREAADLLNKKFPGHKVPFAEGMTKHTIYLAITVRDLAAAISARMNGGEPHA
jgi:hypothetical protein